MIKNKKHKNINYLIYYPNNYDKDKLYPLFIYLHGAGGRGTDIELLKAIGPMYEIDNGRELPCIVVAPQCQADTWFVIMEQLLDFIKAMIDNDNIEKNRVYLSGTSMGGYACWQVAMAHPEWFAAILPVCGGGMYWNAARLKNIPIWAFHGALDPVVYVSESINMVNAVNRAGGNALITIYPKAEHNAWSDTFANDEIYKWLLSKTK